MNTPFKGQINWLPDFIGEELMNQQELQGNKRDISVFEKDIKSEMSEGGFDWYKTEQQVLFWQRILVDKDINLFLAWFKPELEVWDDCDIKPKLRKVGGFIDKLDYPFILCKEDENGEHRYKHAQLPKKENKAKNELLKKVEELTKQAYELLTKAANLKAAAEKL